MTPPLTDMRLLIVDDNATNIALLEQVLERAGYRNTRSTQSPADVPELCADWHPDLLLLDLHMPGQSGYEVMERISEQMAEPESLPVLVLTADLGLEARHQALAMGARDFISKPIDQAEFLLRVHNVLQTRHLQKQLQQQNAALDEAVRKRTAELEEARLETLTALAFVAEFHDYSTHEHTQRVGRLAAMIAQAVDCPGDFICHIRDAAPLHDIGKIAISRHILLKPGKLSSGERLNMMRHVEVGEQILGEARSPTLVLAREIAATHHERWDGQGYLAGLAGEDIPMGGRITALADVFDALTHERPYKEAWDIDRALAEIVSQAGHQFDPRLVAAFQTLDPQTLVDQNQPELIYRAA
jgi:response regulator RpfG family c-di-GMP phosphodiesterase